MATEEKASAYDYAKNKDKEIKNAIKELIKDAIPEGSSIAPGTNITKEEALKWLEEQGKPNFDIGEFYLLDSIIKDYEAASKSFSGHAAKLRDAVVSQLIQFIPIAAESQ